MKYKTLHRLLGFQSCFCCLLASYVMWARYSTSLCIRVVIIISISKMGVCVCVFMCVCVCLNRMSEYMQNVYHARHILIQYGHNI